MFELGTIVVETFEDEDLNRIFIVLTPSGAHQRWVRCGKSGVWLTRAEAVAERRPVDIEAKEAPSWKELGRFVDDLGRTVLHMSGLGAHTWFWVEGHGAATGQQETELREKWLLLQAA